MNDSQVRMHRVVFSIILLIFCSDGASPAPDRGEKPDWIFTLDLHEVAIVSVFKEVEKASGYVFAWPADVHTDIHKPVSIHVKGVSIAMVMNLLLKDSGLTYRVLDRQIVVFRLRKLNRSALQSFPTLGKVSEQNGCGFFPNAGKAPFPVLGKI